MLLSWIYLIIAIVLEVIGTLALKASAGLSKLGPTILMIVSYIICFALCALSLKKIDLSIAYPIWAGVGTMFIAIFGSIYFHEPFDTIKAVSITLIVLGVIGLKFSS